MKDHFGKQKYMNEPSTCNNLRGEIYFAIWYIENKLFLYVTKKRGVTQIVFQSDTLPLVSSGYFTEINT